jgi:hypothetical protein
MNVIKQRCIGYSDGIRRTHFENMLEDGSIKYCTNITLSSGLVQRGYMVDERPYIETPQNNEWVDTCPIE